MPYFLLAVGLIIIYISLRAGFQIEVEPSKHNSFTNVLADQIKDSELIKLKEDIKELRDRINILEDSILLIKLSKESYSENAEEVLEMKSTPIVQDDFKENKYLKNIDKESKNLNDMIYELSDKGLDIESICSALGLGKGEVLLRLGLRKQQK